MNRLQQQECLAVFWVYGVPLASVHMICTIPVLGVIFVLANHMATHNEVIGGDTNRVNVTV